MYYVYSNNQTYGSSENHSGLINLVFTAPKIYLNTVSRPKASWPEIFGFVLNVCKKVAKYVIAKMQNIIHIHLHHLLISML